ncbi:HAD-IIIA family hydrolase [Crocinitomix catalasitica]|nr:HAD-IIIA family hydrolase [Crocinitomix catalasitica]
MDGRVTEVIIMAGGLGTRLQSVIGQRPKVLATVNDVPFLNYVLDHLIENKIETVVLSVGYKWKEIQLAYGDSYKGLSIKYAIESKPLGTGGGIRLAMEQIQNDTFFAMNGDTLFRIPLSDLENFHTSSAAQCSIALKEMENVDRYGMVELNGDQIVGFQEKEFRMKTIINGGFYCINKRAIEHFETGIPFSLEKDYLEKDTAEKKLHGLIMNHYFIDIGVPEDFQNFKDDLHKMNLSDLNIDSEWTLFLDRDGVLNHRLIDDYVKQINELEIIEGVPEALSIFNRLFIRIVVVTNQQGIGRGMMTVEDLDLLHGYLRNHFEMNGGRIDQFYFAPNLASENSPNRKPGTGMALQAKKDFPEIDFKRSIMIGDSESDIEFGMNLGMKTIMLKNARNISSSADYIFENLHEVAQTLNVG